MRTYGEIGGVSFVSHGFDIYNVANKYKLSHNGRNISVFVNNMAELREEITKFLEGEHDESNII